MSSIRFLWILVISLTVSCALSQTNKLSAYDVLMEYGFPKGLLPKGALGYALNRETGEFAVYFDGTCSFTIEGYTLKYKSTITGVISNNRLSKLKGVTVKILLLWLDIVEVRRSGNDIDLSVGIASANFGVENFLECPQCGCGFDCNNLPLNVQLLHVFSWKLESAVWIIQPHQKQLKKKPSLGHSHTPPASTHQDKTGFNFQAKPISSTPIPRFIIFLLFCFLIPSASAKNTTTLTAYDVLQQYNFPVGLLPKGVVSYELDTTTGKFKAHLNGTCAFSIESYDLEYKSAITGVITKDSISSLKGIEVKVLFMWLNIVTVTRDEDELQFSVGIASADFAVSNFYESPTCGCGFDCLNRIGNHMNESRDFALSS